MRDERRRTCGIARWFAASALLLVALLLAPAVAQAASPGSGGWFWPTGSEDFGGMDGWWVYRSSNRSWHMAQDMRAPVGHPVYAVGDGVILESNPAAGYGGVLVVLHKSGDGTVFKAVYGHIHRKSLSKGDHVRAGQIIGTVNGAAHVHFGIHPGRAYPPDGNPYRGHTYDRTKTCGWVDPVRFLRANPRVLPYVAPPLPVVATVETSSTPTVLGTADGSVFWGEIRDGSVLRLRRPMAGGDVTRLGPDDSLPSLDTTRFAATATAASFTLRDRLPVLTANLSTREPAWRAAIAVTGSLKSASGNAFSGASVVVESSVDGAAWTRRSSAITGLTGSFRCSLVPTRTVMVRVRFAPPAPYLAATSAEASVAPRPSLQAPQVPAHPVHTKAVDVTGLLAPRASTGTHTVTLRLQRHDSSGWVDAGTAVTTNHDAGSGTRYVARVRLIAGRWRIRAQMVADSMHAAAHSQWSVLIVR
jgi:hypothetical protein